MGEEVEHVTCRSVKRRTAFQIHNHLSHGMAVSAASGDERIGTCFHRGDAVFFEGF